MHRLLISLFFIIFSGSVLSGCAQTPVTITQPETQQVQSQSPDTAVEKYEFVADESDVDAFSATQKRLEVSAKEYDFGVMVESINGQSVDREHYWALYINNEYASAGASETMLKPGDNVQWVFEEIQQGL